MSKEEYNKKVMKQKEFIKELEDKRRNRIPDKLTKEVFNKIVKYIEEGNYIEVAAQACGIVKQTFYKWMERGRKGKSSLYEEFYKAVQVALAKSETIDNETIRKRLPGWQAAAWHQERMHFNRWGRKTEMMISGSKENPLKIDMTTEQARKILVNLNPMYREEIVDGTAGKPKESQKLIN